MPLTTQQRGRLGGDAMAELSREREPIPLTKAQLAAALAAVDDWVEANTASLNAALPTAARNNLSTRQKARLLAQVVVRRWEHS